MSRPSPEPAVVLKRPVLSIIDPQSSVLLRRVAFACACALVAIAVMSWTTIGRQVPAINGPAFFTAYDVVSSIIAWTTAFLLLSQFREAGAPGLLWLGLAFVMVGAMAFLHLLTIPGLLLNEHLFGNANSALWVRVVWLPALAVGALGFVATWNRPTVGHPRRTLGLALLVLAALIMLIIAAVSVGIDALPDITPRPESARTNYFLVLPAIVAIQAAALIALWRTSRGQTVLSLWLLLALVAGLTETVIGWVLLGVLPDRRYNLNFYIARAAGTISGGILLMALLSQVATLYRRLNIAQQTLERRVAERTADLAQSVSQRDLLLREVYHRVKNNLQVVAAFISLQMSRMADPQAKRAFSRLRDRVYTLGLVHQQLLASADLRTFSAAPFLESLAGNIAAASSTDDRTLAVSVIAQPIPVTLDFAIPLGMLVTELVSNALKHGHGDREASRITIEFSVCGHHRALLVVADDGRHANDASRSLTTFTSFGPKIIAGLTKQLDGELTIDQRNGTRVEIRMPLEEAA